MSSSRDGTRVGMSGQRAPDAPVEQCYSQLLAQRIDVQSEADRVVVIGSGPAGGRSHGAADEGRRRRDAPRSGHCRSAARGLTARIGWLTVVRVHRPLRSAIGRRQNHRRSGNVLYEDIAPGGLTNHWSCAVPRFSPRRFPRCAARRRRVTLADRLRRSRRPGTTGSSPYLRIAGSPTERAAAAGRQSPRRPRRSAPTWKRDRRRRRKREGQASCRCRTSTARKRR